jgi:hypothetical protein
VQLHNLPLSNTLQLVAAPMPSSEATLAATTGNTLQTPSWQWQSFHNPNWQLPEQAAADPTHQDQN